MTRQHRTQEEIDTDIVSLQNEIEELNLTNYELREEIKYLQSDEYYIEKLMHLR